MNEGVAKLQLQLQAARRLLALKEARDRLLPFMRLTMPDPNAPDDPVATLFQTTAQARLMCEILEKVERQELMRVAISMPPQTGKSQILTRGGPSWISGRNPLRHIMVGAYNQDFANEFGDDVREIVGGVSFQQVFPGYELAKGGEAKDLLITTQRGKMAFVGVGGSGTGKPADYFFVDDPIRNDDDANSASYRDKIWRWFNRVVFTRCHGKTPIVVVHTRWHEDDLIGRLCDPNHPGRRRAVADGGYAGIEKNWTYFNIPAVIDDPKLAFALNVELREQTDLTVRQQFGAKPIVSLWPEKFPLTFLAEAKQNDPVGFSALRMGKPTPDDGAYFRVEDIVEYDPHELPGNLRKYGASDHAVSKAQGRDSTVLGCVGIDENDDIWVLPDLIWDRLETDQTVEEMLVQFSQHKPQLWWMESELISKSFGPFLRKRMIEEKIYTSIDAVTPAKDKPLRARSIQGRMRMRKVRFPRFAPWWPDARSQLLRFPAGAHDDFVDWLAHIGQGLTKEMGPRLTKPKGPQHPTGSIQWILANASKRAREGKRRELVRGW